MAREYVTPYPFVDELQSEIPISTMILTGADADSVQFTVERTCRLGFQGESDDACVVTLSLYVVDPKDGTTYSSEAAASRTYTYSGASMDYWTWEVKPGTYILNAAVSGLGAITGFYFKKLKME